MAVSLKPETIFQISGFSVTNSLFTAIIIVTLLVTFLVVFGKKINTNPTGKLQLLLESLVTGIHDLAIGVMGEKLTRIFFPFVFSFFVLIIISNWFGLLPFVGSIGFSHHIKNGKESLPILVFGKEENERTEHKTETVEESSKSLYLTTREEIEAPIFRSPSADLNFTISLAIISFILIQYAGLKVLGFGHLAKFFDYRVKIQKGWKIILTPLTFLINFFNKTLELILELSKIISYSLRLFGNIFAGEVLLIIVTSLTYGFLTFPFIGLEIFVGLIQATVFMFLTMVFIKVGTDLHH